MTPLTDVVRRHGRPLTMYHGTKRRFDAFHPMWWDDEPGFFFTPRLAYARQYARNGGRVISAHLRMANPYRCDEMAWGWGKCLSLEEARAAGHDGYVVAPYSLGTMFIVFRPEDIVILDHDVLERTGLAT